MDTYIVYFYISTAMVDFLQSIDESDSGPTMVQYEGTRSWTILSSNFFLFFSLYISNLIYSNFFFSIGISVLSFELIWFDLIWFDSFFLYTFIFIYINCIRWSSVGRCLLVYNLGGNDEIYALKKCYNNDCATMYLYVFMLSI
jgi:hypothetical protein